MKIALDYQVFTLQRYGGISRYLTRLTKELLNAGEDVQIFAAFYQNNYIKELPAAAVHGCHVRRFLPKTTRAFLALNRLAGAPAMRHWRPNIVHETYYARASSRVKGAPLILTVHDMTHEVCRADFAPNDPTSEMKRLAVARADHIICVSRSTQRDLIELLGVDERKTSVILLGVDPPSPTSTAALPSIALERPFLLFVGVRASYKNFDGFLRAAAANPFIRDELDIVAFGGGPFTSGEVQMIESLGFAGRVMHVVGDDRVLGEYYARAAALVYPSRYEGFGLPPLEAMAYGCPVVCSNVSSLPEVTQNAAELFDPADECAMGKTIESVISSPSRRHELVERGRERARALTWEKCARETLAVYKSLAGSL